MITSILVDPEREIEGVEFSAAEIEEGIEGTEEDGVERGFLPDLARDIMRRQSENPLSPVIFVVQLRGGMMFAADLMRRLSARYDITVQLQFGFPQSYATGTESGNMDHLLRIYFEPENAIIYLIEDLMDTADTLTDIVQQFEDANALSVKTVCLINKTARRKVAFQPDFYVFLMTEDIFIVGYCMDYCERYRELPYIGRLHLYIFETVDGIIKRAAVSEEEVKKIRFGTALSTLFETDDSYSEAMTSLSTELLGIDFSQEQIETFTTVADVVNAVAKEKQGVV